MIFMRLCKGACYSTSSHNLGSRIFRDSRPPALDPLEALDHPRQDPYLWETERMATPTIPKNELSKWPEFASLPENFKRRIKVAFSSHYVGALVTDNDQLWMVGRNECGSLGTGSNQSFITPVPIRVNCLCGVGISNFAIGGESKKKLSLFALTESGTVYGFGFNGKGNLGLRFATASPVLPSRVAFPQDCRVTSISCGAGHVLAITSTGQLWAWGVGKYGQVGNGNPQDHQFPVRLNVLERRRLVEFVMVAAGSYHSVALSRSGHVYTWGRNDKGQLGNGLQGGVSMIPNRIEFPTKDLIVKIACGRNHTLALSTAGNIYVFGHGYYGSLGNGSMNVCPLPVKIAVKGPDSNKEVRVIDIGACAYTAVSTCVGENNKVYMWGKVAETNGKTVDVPWETLMTSMSDVFSSFHIPQVMYKALVATDFTANDHYIDNIPAEIMRWPGLKWIPPHHFDNFDKVKLAYVCGSGFEQTAILLTRDDEVFFMGKNVHGSFGTGDETEEECLIPMRNTHLSYQGVISFNFGLDVEGGCMCLFALTSSGKVFSWGYNEFGELGLGFSCPTPVLPTQIGGSMANAKIVDIACGADHTLAISARGDLFCWGYNHYGQVGNNHPGDVVSSPVKLTHFDGKRVTVISAAGGQNHSLACTDEGEVYAWGRNDKSQLGIKLETRGYHPTPHKVIFPNRRIVIKKVSAGRDFSVALSTSGALYFWGTGDDEEGQLFHRTPARILEDAGPVKDIVCAHWSTLSAVIATAVNGEAAAFMWGNVLGKERAGGVVMAKSINDVFALAARPCCTPYPIICRDFNPIDPIDEIQIDDEMGEDEYESDEGLE